MKVLYLVLVFGLSCLWLSINAQSLRLNDRGYFSTPGLDVTVFDDIYPEGHQTGVSIVQHGQRVVANGDLRLEISPGQWSPIPKGGQKEIDTLNQTITQELWYPDSSKNRKGFNPIIYPDLQLTYRVSVTPAEGHGFMITVDLDEPIPSAWEGKIGFNMELFPGHLFGKSFIVDDETGLFTPSPYGPIAQQKDGEILGEPLGEGKSITIAPASPRQKITFTARSGKLQLWDGRINHNNGWFIVRSEIPTGRTNRVVEWLVDPVVEPGWTYEPVIQISQVGYYPDQKKIAILELDRSATDVSSIRLYRHTSSEREEVQDLNASSWGNFLRYQYYQFDFTEVRKEGIYSLAYGNVSSHPFRISQEIYDRNVWQPVMEYFLPVQMCHMRVNEKYRVWHDVCHLDDARMAPTNLNHFDGYKQGENTLTSFQSQDIVPGLNEGGWHDAGDYDLRVESQIGTVWNLALAMEEFNVGAFDATTVDLDQRVVEIHQPDAKSDFIQQIEHGLASVLGGYRSLGRLYRGIICNDLRQYVMLGDAASMTDNRWSDSPSADDDDRWVFTEENPSRELYVAGGLAAASRILRETNPVLAKEALAVSEAVFNQASSVSGPSDNLVRALVELVLTTNRADYKRQIIQLQEFIGRRFDRVGWMVGRVLSHLEDASFVEQMNRQAAAHSEVLLKNAEDDSPYGVPYRPNIWGAGWSIQRFGVEQYFFNKTWPQFGTEDLFINALNFVLGVHPGSNTASFASGIGAQSTLVAYGVNRADWSYIPGGVASGTALIRPDLPELKVWPFFWSQTEYVMGGGSTNFLFLALAVKDHFTRD